MPKLIQGFAVISRSWTEFKKVINGTEKSLSLQFEETDKDYAVFAITETHIYYECRIFKNSKTIEGLSAELVEENAEALTDFESNWKASGNN